MATPNDSGPPKKPQVPGSTPAPKPQPAAGTPPAKPQPAAGTPPAKPQPAQPAKPQAAAPVKPQAAQPAKPQAAAPAKPQGAAPAKPQAAAPAKPQPAPAKAPPAGDKPAMGKLVSAGDKSGAKPPAGDKPVAKAPAAGDKTARPPAAKGLSGKGPSARRPPVAVRGQIKTGGRKLGQVLVDLGFIDDDQLWEVLDQAKAEGELIGRAAVNRGLITEDQLLQALADQCGLKVANLEEAKPTAEATNLVPETMATVYKVLPLSYKDNLLTVVIGDPTNLPALDDLRNFLGIKEVHAVLATPKAISDSMARWYAGKEESIMDIIQALQDEDGTGARRNETSIDLESVMEMQDAAPVRKLINMVFLLGIKDHASDIHFEPFEDEYKIRMKADGVLFEMVPPPRHLAMAIASRIKVMSNLDIAERRVPQDGRIELNLGGNQVDMRVSVLPTLFGESVVIRILDRSAVSLDLNKVGMNSELLSQFRELIHRPNGIVLVTGPTGSGKTTTLYSALNELNEITEKIITTEDPVEYDIDGIVQCQMNSEIGLTFAAALRAILRQDPDKILVGEIRDLETAQIAVQAALTGHLVFSTLHTNDAPSTITRMRDMGLETFLITACVEGILAQRLVRKICEDCKEQFEPSQEVLMELNLRPEDAKGKTFYYGKGCDRCNNTGHKGRTGLHELIIINDELRDMISAGASTDQLRAACRKMGMTTLRESGLRALFNGVTTIEEVVRETVLEDES
jgi:type IV pilus assembly protein PilB